VGELRVTGGVLRGRKILVPAHGEARYTASKVRAAIFNLIGDVTHYDVLDLFAGSGSLSIEALSRGARRAVCVEKDRGMADVLKENLRRMGLDKDCVVMNMDVIYALPALSKRGDTYDLIVVDPPYEMGLIPATLDLLKKERLCGDGSLLVLEHSKREQLPGFIDPDSLRNRLYGDTAISLIRCGTKQC
jgi:16S rRNA (guanine966-N2)-methyltransferase